MMADRAHHRFETYHPEVLSDFGQITEIKNMTWIGSYSWCTPADKRRLLDEEGIITQLHDVPQTPPEVARDYLICKYPDKRRHIKAQYGEINKPRSHPRLCIPGRFADMAYVDLRSAYWSITRIVGWDIDYYPGQWIGKRSDNDDFPLPEHKVARNALVSAGLLSPTHVWTGVGLKSIKTHNPLVNYDLWALVNDVLHAIAMIAVNYGAVYINTDGYIMARGLANTFISEVAEWGLQARIKHQGDADVYAVGSYKIGDYATKHKPHFASSILFNVYEPDSDWLKLRFGKLARSHIAW
jgi:hypothetical protein